VSRSRADDVSGYAPLTGHELAEEMKRHLRQLASVDKLLERRPDGLYIDETIGLDRGRLNALSSEEPPRVAHGDH
jgi:hypothetical protein